MVRCSSLQDRHILLERVLGVVKWVRVLVIGGEICCEEIISCDISGIFDCEIISGLKLHETSYDGYLISFGVNERRLKYLFEIFEKLSKA